MIRELLGLIEYSKTTEIIIKVDEERYRHINENILKDYILAISIETVTKVDDIIRFKTGGVLVTIMKRKETY